MKKTFFFTLISILISSCTTVKYSEYGDSLDYSSYTSQGFFLTEAPSVSFNYEPIGSVIGVSISGYDKNKSEKESYTKVLSDGSRIYNPDFGKNQTNYISANYEGALFQLVNESKKIGANGIIGLKFNTSIIENGRLEIRAYGMAIKK